MKPSQTLYILRRLRATCAQEGDAQSAKALEIAARAIETAQNTDRAQRSGVVQAEPVKRAKGPRMKGVRAPGGIAGLVAGKHPKPPKALD